MTRPLLILLLLTGCTGKNGTMPNRSPVTAISGAEAVERSARIDAELLAYIPGQPLDVTLGVISRTLQRDGYLRFESRFSDAHGDLPVLGIMELHTDIVPLGGCKVDLNYWSSSRLYGIDLKQKGDEEKKEMPVWHLDLSKLNPKVRRTTPEMFAAGGYTFGYKLLMTTLTAAQNAPRSAKGKPTTDDESYDVYAARKQTQIELAKALSHAITLCHRNPSEP